MFVAHRIECSFGCFVKGISEASMAASISRDDEISTSALEGAKHYSRGLSGKDEHIIVMRLKALVYRSLKNRLA